MAKSMSSTTLEVRVGMASRQVVTLALLLCCLVGGAAPTRAGPLCSLHRHHDSLHASCVGLGLTAVSSLLPPDVTSLDLRHNKLTTVSQHTFAGFRRLQSLDLSGNSISSIDNCAFAGLTDLQMLSLSHNNLTVVDALNPKGRGFGGAGGGTTECGSAQQTDSGTRSEHRIKLQGVVSGLFLSLHHLNSLDLSNNRLGAISMATFSGLYSLQRLDLSGNELDDISNDTFSDLPHLVSLDLSQNRLRSLEPRALAGLPQLRHLNLKGNEFTYDNHSFPPCVFRPVASSLTSLVVTGERMAVTSSQLPDAALSVLRSVQHLTVTGLNRIQFGIAFAAMESLSTLDLIEECDVISVTNNSFSGLSSTRLTSLRLERDVHLLQLETCAFCPLQHLQLLSLRNSNRLGLEKALLSLYAFVGRNISVVDFHHVIAIYKKQGSKGTVLEETVTRFLLQTCVSSLILRGNDITSISRHSLTKPGSLFNRCIQNVDIQDNYIFSLNAVEILQFFFLSTNLRSLQLQDQNTCTLRKAVDHERFGYSVENVQPVNYKLLFPTQPHFQYLNLSGVCTNIGTFPKVITFKQPNSLKVLDFSYAYIAMCASELKGLDRLESLNLSRINCQNFRLEFFDSFPALKELSLQTITFNPRQLQEHARRLFRNIPLLRRFDFSFNHLTMPLGDLLHAQRNLRELRLAWNGYSGIPLDLENHPALTFLDLSNNDISQLAAQDRDMLDRHVAAHRHLSLHLHGNPIACTCRTLPFIRWLGTTHVQLDHAGNYSCVSERGTLRNTWDMIVQLDREWQRCVGPAMLFGAVGGMLLLLSSIGVAWAVAVNATRLRFFLTVFKRIKMPRRQQFNKDAYLSYCDADTELAVGQLKRVLQDQRRVRLLIKDLPVDAEATHFYLLPGDNEVEKMLDHIEMSWKVVLVLTEALSRDRMAGLMTRAALQSISDRQTERVVLLCMGLRHLPDLASLRALLQTVPEKQVIFVPHGAGDAHPAWDALAEVILN